ncbi:MAG: hypothetical protein QOD53_734, partial [Thermoleophilaceae bacterium]|nr:hypothetical protein [Thermoleophilaceae bacterium]
WSDRVGSGLCMPRVLAPGLRDLRAARRRVRSEPRRAADGRALVAEPADPGP